MSDSDSASSSAASSTASRTASSQASQASQSSLQEGCVKCDNNVSCPQCAEDELCVTTSLTCTQCPRTYCQKKTSSGNGSSSSSSATALSSAAASDGASVYGKLSSSNKVGPIVGGVVGGVAFVVIVAVLGLLYYKYYNRKRSALPHDPEYLEKETQGPNTGSQGPATGLPLRQSMLRSQSTSSSRVRTRNKRNNRSSAATIQTSTASNIIPVAYIPGVTTNLTKKNLSKGRGRASRRFFQESDRKSHITLGSSILGDDDDEEQQGLQNISETDRPQGSDPERGTQDPALVTAKRGRPKLVQIEETEEQEQEHEQHGEPPHAAHQQREDLDIPANSAQDATAESASTNDLDLRHYSIDTSNSESRDPFRATHEHTHSDSNSEGSFFLDVEMVNSRQ